ncbi:MAG TPA: helix-turn-helix domain-containing protein [Candidatus Andersenbacteria bacterium]|nr:helix-turn-helix domain-containing protein [Candidatus Andersenbacteria bacterium]
MIKGVYTTGQAAKICRVSQQTIIRCFDRGELRGFYVPGTRFRRIPQKELSEFIREYGLPGSELVDEVSNQVLIVSQDHVLIENLRHVLSQGSLNLTVVDNGFEAGLRVASSPPHVVVVDCIVGVDAAQNICRELRCNQQLSITPLVAVCTSVEEKTHLARWLPNDTFVRPFDAPLLAHRLLTLARAAK